MTLSYKPLPTISEADLQELLTNQVREGKTIDYKRSLPSNADADKKEFLADVSSFANTAGGHLIYGMTEEGGVPATITGIALKDADTDVQRMENLIRDGLQPRLTGVQIAPVPLNSGANVIILRIPRSWALPHRVILGGHDKFYGRNMTGKYPLDVPELRALFMLSESLVDRIRAFRSNRLNAIAHGETPVAMGTSPKTVLHLVPFN